MISFQAWKSFLKTVQCVSAVFSIFLNSLLILLIVTRSPRTMGSYKYLMIYTAIFELFYSLWDIITEPVVHSYGSAFVIFRNFENSVFNREQSFYLIIVLCGCFGFSLACFEVHFVYRYGTINKVFWDKYLSGKKFLFCFVFPFLYAIVWSVICIHHHHFTAHSDEYMRTSISDGYDLEMEDISYMFVIFHPLDDHGVPHPNWIMLGTIFFHWAQAGFSLFCVTFFGVKCYLEITKTMSTMSTQSKTSKSLQHQLFQALVIQTMIPICLLYTPISVLYAFPMLKMDVGVASSFLAATIAIFPSIDPLPNLIIIKPYRIAILNALSRVFPFLCKSQKYSSNSVAMDIIDRSFSTKITPKSTRII